MPSIRPRRVRRGGHWPGRNSRANSDPFNSAPASSPGGAKQRCRSMPKSQSFNSAPASSAGGAARGLARNTISNDLQFGPGEFAGGGPERRHPLESDGFPSILPRRVRRGGRRLGKVPGGRRSTFNSAPASSPGGAASCDSSTTTPTGSFNSAPASSPGGASRSSFSAANAEPLQFGPGEFAGGGIRAVRNLPAIGGPSIRPRRVRRGGPDVLTARRAPAAPFNSAPASSPGGALIITPAKLQYASLQFGPGEFAGGGQFDANQLTNRYQPSIRPRRVRRGGRPRKRAASAADSTFNSAPASSPGGATLLDFDRKTLATLQFGPGEFAGGGAVQGKSLRTLSDPSIRPRRVRPGGRVNAGTMFRCHTLQFGPGEFAGGGISIDHSLPLRSFLQFGPGEFAGGGVWLAVRSFVRFDPSIRPRRVRRGGL